MMKDATKTGFTPDLVKQAVTFDVFKKWFDNHYTGKSAEDVWTSIGGKLPEKKDKK
jgi:hypothetical protein